MPVELLPHLKIARMGYAWPGRMRAAQVITSQFNARKWKVIRSSKVLVQSEIKKLLPGSRLEGGQDFLGIHSLLGRAPCFQLVTRVFTSFLFLRLSQAKSNTSLGQDTRLLWLVAEIGHSD